MWLSCRIGSRVPSAVVVRASPTGTKSWMYPVEPSAATTPTASTAVTAQPASASRPGRCRSSRGSSSYPASRNRKPRPMLDSRVMLAVLARPRPCGPMSTPPSRKMTTCGMRGPGSSATTSGASAATSATTNRVSSPLVTPTAPAASPGRPRGRRQGSPFPGQTAAKPRLTSAQPATRKPGQPAGPGERRDRGLSVSAAGQAAPPAQCSDGLLREGEGHRPLVIDLSVE